MRRIAPMIEPMGGNAVENSSGSSMGTMNRDDVNSPSTSGQPAAPLIEQTRQKAGEVMDQARQQVQSKLGDQKDRATEGLGQVAQALRQTGQQLRDSQQEGIGQYAEMAADQVERFSGYLKGQDIGQLVGEVESLARRQPALFVGSAFMLGFFLTRFLKSSSDGAGSGSGAVWDRSRGSNAAWDRSTWSNQSSMGSGAMAGAASGMSASSMSASSGTLGTSGATGGGSAYGSPTASVPQNWRPAQAVGDEDEVDLAAPVGRTASGGPTDDE
jgi:hypothetical protein